VRSQPIDRAVVIASKGLAHTQHGSFNCPRCVLRLWIVRALLPIHFISRVSSLPLVIQIPPYQQCDEKDQVEGGMCPPHVGNLYLMLRYIKASD